MNTLHLSIQPLSPLLASTGQGAVLVDADAVFHQTGFPYIPARRLKGLLRESLTEVLEIMGRAEEEIAKNVRALFGHEGDDHNNGKIAIGNANVSQWEDIVKYMSSDNSVTPDDVKSYLATEVQQTALDEGTAKKHSLRNYRVVLPRKDLTFVSEVAILKDISDDESKWLRNAVSNLRYMGSRRNRGFGHVRCSLAKAPDPEKTNESLFSSIPKERKTAITSIDVSLRTDSPIIISRQDGDNNTLQSDDVISGSQLRGALARLYMRTYVLKSKDAHLDPDFHAIFLSGRLKFGHLHHRNAKPVPAFIHREKYNDGNEGLNVFHSSGVITKSVGGFGLGIEVVGDGSAVIMKMAGPKKTSQFHNSRPDRTAGKNTGGQLFYYESLEDGQTFNGCITGDMETMRSFCKLFQVKEQLYMGRSKSAQYGRVTVSFKASEAEPKVFPSIGNIKLMVAETPLVLTNEWGHPALDEHTFLNALNRSIQAHDPKNKVKEVLKVAGSITHVEHYNGVWHAKNGKYPAYTAGTTFLVNLESDAFPSRLSVGRFTDLGYGSVRMLPDIGSISLLEEKEENEDSDTPVKQTPVIISDIRKNKESVRSRNLLDDLAIQKASDVRGLNNHQCGRMESLMVESNSIDQVHAWLAENNGKPIWKALAKARVLINSRNEPDAQIPDKAWISKGWEDARYFWKAFFAALRKLNKT